MSHRRPGWGGPGRWAAAVLVAGAVALTGCSADSPGGDDTAAPSTQSSATVTGASSSADSSRSSAAQESSESSTAPSPTAATTLPGEGSVTAPPSAALPSTALSVSPDDPAGSVEIGVPGTDPTEEAPLSEECAGITTAMMAQWVGGPAFDAADDITIDPALGDSSCIFSTLTGSHSVLVEKNELATYLGGELASLSEADAMATLEQALTLSSTDPEITSTTIAGRTATVITAATFTGGSNGLAFTIVDGTLVIVTAEGAELAAIAGGLGGTATRVLEQVLTR